MVKAYDLYGTKVLSPASLCEHVSRVLNISFEGRDSSYLGEYYLAGNLGAEHFKIQVNTALDDEAPEVDYLEYSVLLYVNGTLRADPLKGRLASIEGLTFLRRDIA